ncbi:hypothetical protein [Fortiea contorta]|uniref:hypothetical protein n=1 Tax=Fortiea contorta TaxID=1892405 RepID=UPI00034C18DA|nr:hypothetical protein [Fortiea contorta]
MLKKVGVLGLTSIDEVRASYSVGNQDKINQHIQVLADAVQKVEKSDAIFWMERPSDPEQSVGRTQALYRIAHKVITYLNSLISNEPTETTPAVNSESTALAVVHRRRETQGQRRPSSANNTPCRS